MRRCETGAFHFRFIEIGTMQNYFGSEACYIPYFDGWGTNRHYDGAWDTQSSPGKCYTLRMIAYEDEMN